jgi:4-hydroxy-3-methylbut-2-enyl diphosphate reductase
VHNPGIKADLSDRGIRTADLADQVEGGTLVIRAHGVPKSEFEQVKGKGDLEVIDATCTWVLQSQKAARELADAGYTVCIIGHEDHPEVKGVRSYAGEKHVVVDDMDRSTWERVPRTKKIGVLSQSTILPQKLEEFAAFCLRRAHDLRVVNTVCPVTLTRQDDSVALAKEVDAMIVVGGKNSSNTKELAVKCAQILPETIHVADADELAAEHAGWLRGKARIGITGGTSTPEVDLEEVRERVYALTA